MQGFISHCLILILLVVSFYTANADQDDQTISSTGNLKSCRKVTEGDSDNFLEDGDPSCDKVTTGNPPQNVVPIDDLKNGLYRSILPPDGDIIPSWLNVTLYNIGVDFAKNYFFTVYLTPIAAISLFTSSPLVTPILMSTGKSNTIEKANRRYLATILQMKVWYENVLRKTLSDDEEFNADVLQSLHNVRGIHFMLTRNFPWSKMQERMRNKTTDGFTFTPEIWDAFAQDLEMWDAPKQYREWPEHIRQIDFDKNPPPLFNQLALLMTQFMLGGLQILIPERSGATHATEEELKGYLHMWAVLGHAIGIEDQFNIALQPNLQAAREYYQELFNRYLIPSLYQMTDEAKLLHEAMLKSFIHAMFGENGESYLSLQQMLIISFEDVLGIPVPNIRATMPMSHKILRGGLLNNAVSLMGHSSYFRSWINAQVISRYCEDGGKLVFEIDVKDPSQVVQSCYA